MTARKRRGVEVGYAVRPDCYQYVERRKREGTEVLARDLCDQRTDPAEDKVVFRSATGPT